MNLAKRFPDQPGIPQLPITCVIHFCMFLRKAMHRSAKRFRTLESDVEQSVEAAMIAAIGIWIAALTVLLKRAKLRQSRPHLRGVSNIDVRESVLDIFF